MEKHQDKLSNLGILFLRLLMGSGIAYHGYGKVFGGHMTMLTPGLAKMGFPMPEVFAWLAALSEFAGGILVVLGLFTRVAAFFVFSTMSVAAFVVHAADLFQVKELALAYWTISLALIFIGGGQYSFDQKACCKKSSS